MPNQKTHTDGQPDLKTIEHIWNVLEKEAGIVDVQPTNLQQLFDVLMSKETTVSGKWFQNLSESLP